MRIIKNVEENRNMQAYTYVSKGKFELREKPKPTLMQERDAIVKVTLATFPLGNGFVGYTKLFR